MGHYTLMTQMFLQYKLLVFILTYKFEGPEVQSITQIKYLLNRSYFIDSNNMLTFMSHLKQISLGIISRKNRNG